MALEKDDEKMMNIASLIAERINQNVDKPASVATKEFRQWLNDQTSYLPIDSTITCRIFHLDHGPDIPTCKCGQTVSWRPRLHKYSTFCSSKCAHTDVGVRSKIEATVTERYGTPTIGNARQIIDKRKATLVERYGTDNLSSLMTDRSRVSFSSRNPNSNNKQQIEQLVSQSYTQTEIGKVLGISQPRVSSLMSHLDIQTTRDSLTSRHQREITEFIKSLSVEVVENDSTTIKPYHLDIVVPSFNVAVEVNGLYWHSQLAGRDRAYHSHKTALCQAKGITLIHIFDVEWDTKQEAVKHRLCSLFKCLPTVMARKCEIRHVDQQEERQFLTQYHTQGYTASTVCYGLYHANHLIGVMSMVKSRHTKDCQWELLRYCSSISVAGGLSRLFSHFITNYDPSSVVSYADRRWGSGNSYRHLGFTYSHNSAPNYWYFQRNNAVKLFSRISFQKHKLSATIPSFNPLLSEWDNMKNNGYDRVWDCGNAVWKWKQPSVDGCLIVGN